MKTAATFADAIGRKNIASAVGLGLTAVSNAVVRGWFPPSWFIALSDLANGAGIECPPELFNMIPVSNTQKVDCVNGDTDAGQKGDAA